MKTKSLKRTGIWILIYALLCAGFFNFTVWLEQDMEMRKGISQRFPAPARLVTNIADISIAIGVFLGFSLISVGGIALILNKAWGRKQSLLGVWISIISSLAAILLIFICYVVGKYLFYDFIPLIVMTGIAAGSGILIIKKLMESPDGLLR